MNEQLEQKRQDFISKGLFQIADFELDNFRYTLYRINPNNPTPYITGDRFDWEVGLQYEKEIRMIAKFYQVEEDVKMAIEKILKDNRI